MKITFAVATLLLASTSLFAQMSPSAPSTGQTGTSTTTSQPSQHKSGMDDHMQHMQAMQTEMQNMKAQVDKLRADAQKVQDPNTRTALLDNADLWQRFVDRMESHIGMMMQGMHHPGMMHGQHPHNPPAGESSQNPR